MRMRCDDDIVDQDNNKKNENPLDHASTTADCVPSLHLVINNIQKLSNIRKLFTSAAAFGCQTVLVVGQAKLDLEKDIPPSLRPSIRLATGSNKKPTTETVSSSTDLTTNNNNHNFMTVQRFDKWNECVQYLQEQRICLVGVEIHELAWSLEDFFRPPHEKEKRPSPLFDTPKYQGMAFLMGNEGKGISPKHMDSCQAFVRIPQYGGGTASLNVYVAASIVLQRYRQWQLQCQAKEVKGREEEPERGEQEGSYEKLKNKSTSLLSQSVVLQTK